MTACKVRTEMHKGTSLCVSRDVSFPLVLDFFFFFCWRVFYILYAVYIYIMCFCLFLTSSMNMIFRIHITNITISTFFLINIHYPENLPSVLLLHLQHEITHPEIIVHFIIYAVSSIVSLSPLYIFQLLVNCWPSCVYLIKALHTEKKTCSIHIMCGCCEPKRHCLQHIQCLKFKEEERLLMWQ